MYKAKLSGEAYLNHCSMEIPFPLDFEIFLLSHQETIHKQIRLEDFFPKVHKSY